MSVDSLGEKSYVIPNGKGTVFQIDNARLHFVYVRLYPFAAVYIDAQPAIYREK